MIEINYTCDDLEDFMRLKPIAPEKTLVDKRREAIEALNKVYKSNPNKNYASRVMKATDKVKMYENLILKEKQNA